VVSQLIEEVTAHAQSDSLEDAREICADGTYFPNNLRIIIGLHDSELLVFKPSIFNSYEDDVNVLLRQTSSHALW